jgi:LmbE family N-acetylglucosaminyl deacetylase
MKHIYLSPHLDDAVLSCGGTIHRRTAAGDRVQVITLLAGEIVGSPPVFARTQHDYWGNPPRPMILRRAEDVAALARLDAEACHLSYLDAVYRASVGGKWLYNGEEALFGDVHPADPLLREDMRALYEDLTGILPSPGTAVIYAPLGVGHHVDHQIGHALGRRLEKQRHRLVYYEEVPYALQPGAVEAALGAIGAHDWCPELVPLDAGDLAAKIEASAYYHTQLSVLFGSSEEMPYRLQEFAESHRPVVALGERLWWPARDAA